jgi:hypothetical protein
MLVLVHHVHDLLLQHYFTQVLIFRMHNSDPTPQGVENRNILLRIKCVLTALHVNCMILFDKVL